MTSQEMMRTKAKPGYQWENMAPLGTDPIWQQVPTPINTKGTIFGYEASAFLRKQYK